MNGNQIKKYQDKIIELFSMQNVIDILDKTNISIFAQFYIGNQVYHYLDIKQSNLFGLEKYGEKISNNCLKIDIRKYIIEPSKKVCSKEKINKVLVPFRKYRNSIDVDNFEIIYPRYNYLKEEIVYMKVQGHAVLRDEFGYPLLTWGILIDFNEQIMLEENLVKVNEIFNFSEISGKLGAYSMDVRIEPEKYYASKNYASIFGIEKTEDNYYPLDLAFDVVGNYSKSESDKIFQEHYKFMNGIVNNYDHQYRIDVNGKTKWINSTRICIEKDEFDRVIKFVGSVRDITELKEKELELTEMNDMFALGQRVGEFFTWKMDLEIDKEKVFGPLELSALYDAKQNIDGSYNFQDLFNKDITDEFQKYNSECDNFLNNFTLLLNGAIKEFEAIHPIFIKGEYRWHQVNAKSIVLDIKNKPLKIIGVTKDITSIKNKELELNTIAHYDHLTGLMNRNKFETDYYNGALKYDYLGLIDFNKFKKFNDLYGHQFGDLCLHAFAQRIIDVFRIFQNEDYLFYRLQGDEYIINFSFSESDFKTIENFYS